MSTATEGELEPGHVVAGRYRVVGTLGQGGFGAVYEAEHVTLKRVVALKVLLPKLAGNAEVVQRFMREAQSAASIGHPGIVEVFDLGSDEGIAFLAMERLEGEELYDRIQREHPLDPKLVARIGMDLADAIAAAHAEGIVHRDLKPQNVFLARKGRRTDVVKVLDFGIAKLADADRADAPLTRTGQVFGTPLYMSPAQLRGAKDLDGRADVYAMGAILYEALAGQPPFAAESYPELVIKVASEQPRPLAELRPDVPPSLVEIVEAAMRKDREERIQSAEELANALDGFLRDPDAVPSVRPGVGAVARPSGADAFAKTMESGDHGDGLKATSDRWTETPFASSSVRPAAPTRSSKPWIAALGALLLVGGGVTAAVLSQGGGADDDLSSATNAASPASNPEAPTAGSTGEAPVAPPEEQETVEAAEPPAPAESEPPTTRTVRFEVRPRGTEVRIGDRVLCETPCEQEVADQQTTFEFRRHGYRAVERTVEAPLPETVEARLERIHRVSGTSTGTESTMAPEPPPLRAR